MRVEVDRSVRGIVEEPDDLGARVYVLREGVACTEIGGKPIGEGDGEGAAHVVGKRSLDGAEAGLGARFAFHACLFEELAGFVAGGLHCL